MKNRLTLVFLFSTFLSFAQKALYGSILIQYNKEDYELLGRIRYPKDNGSYREQRIPSLALGYMKFQKSGNYFRVNLNGWYVCGAEDVVVGNRDFSTNTIYYSPTKLKALGGRIGLSEGFLLNLPLGSLDIYFEPTFTLGMQYLNSVPTSSSVYAEKNREYYLMLGPNFALHKAFGKFFLRLDLLMPFAQFGFETNESKNPSFPIAQNTHSNFFLHTRILNGIGIGGGYTFD